MRFRRAFKQQVLTAAEVERRLYGAPLPDLNKTAPPPSGGALEAKHILNNLLTQDKKGTVMPDLQSALKNAIETWEPTPTNKPVQQPKEKSMSKRITFPIKNNVTRATFEYIKLHPGTTAAAASRDLVKQGYKESSVTALMAQFVRSNLAVRDNNHGYRVVVDEYIPMKASQKYAKKPKAHAKVKPAKATDTKAVGIAALHTDGGETQVAKRVVNTIVLGRTPEEVIKHMTVLQARELYDYLKKIFGG